eukprot:jgi/Mesen1/4584/ME000232S03838
MAFTAAFEAINTASQGTLVGIVAAVGVLAITTLFLTSGQAEVKGKKTTQLSGGSISKEEVEKKWKQYDEYFQQNEGSGVAVKKEAPQFVDTFYNLVTDIYEWGWGQSFHFSPAIPGKSDKEATRMHEEYVCKVLDMKPGMKVLDAGCGVGGPMRAIAAKSRSKVVGITINDYQVQRATHHNKKAGLQALCQVDQGNFLQMPYADGTFDAAYSIEATCHAPKLVEVYSEILRVLKPGSLYCTYEWVKTNKYDGKNPAHVKIIDDICHGNALPDMRSYTEIVDAAKEAGFEIVENRDLAAPPAKPWYRRLQMGRFAYYRNHIMVSIVSAIGIAPKGLLEVHNMLVNVAISLSQGGETGVFSPAHMLVLRKPLSK